ncbi:hypothetical protein LTS17_008000 [Exophiala oligosperma]
MSNKQGHQVLTEQHHQTSTELDDLKRTTKTDTNLFQVLEGETVDVSHTSEVEINRIVRKIDPRIIPLLWVTYGIQLIDKSGIGTYATFGLRKDLHLVGQQYAWLTTAFYLSYMVFQLPFTTLIQRFPMGRTLPILIMLWGVVAICIGFAQNFAQILAMRILLGMLESCVSSGFILTIASWYTTREHASRSLAFTTGNSGVLIVANFIMYGFGSITFSHPDQEFFGGLTVCLGITGLFLLDTPSEVRWLTTTEKELAISRMLSNQTGHDETGKRWNWKQTREAVTDPVLYLHTFNAFLSAVPNGGLTAFGSIINVSLGFSE